MKQIGSEFTKVGNVDDVPEGEGKAFEVNGRMIAVFRQAGKFFAIEDHCPHMGASLATGFLQDGAVACPWHAWRFDICNGAWCDNPRVKLDAFEVDIRGSDIWVGNNPKIIEE